MKSLDFSVNGPSSSEYVSVGFNQVLILSQNLKIERRLQFISFWSLINLQYFLILRLLEDIHFLYSTFLKRALQLQYFPLRYRKRQEVIQLLNKQTIISEICVLQSQKLSVVRFCEE
jgi:hypothetical protein